MGNEENAGFPAEFQVPRRREKSCGQSQRPREEINRRYIGGVLRQTGGKIRGPGGAAEMMGTNPNTLRSRMRKWGIAFGRPPAVKDPYG